MNNAVQPKHFLPGAEEAKAVAARFGLEFLG